MTIIWIIKLNLVKYIHKFYNPVSQQLGVFKRWVHDYYRIFFLRTNRIGIARKNSWHHWKGSILMRFEVMRLAITLKFSKMTKIDVMCHVLTLKIVKVVRNIKEDCILGENCRATRGCFNGYLWMYFMTTFIK